MGHSKGILIAAIGLFVGTAVWGAVGEADAQSGQTLDLSGKLNLDRIRACGFVTEKPIAYLGTIVGSKDASNNLSQGDLVYIELEPGKQVKAGDRLAISRFSKEIEHPVSKKAVGYALYFPATVIILDGKGPIVPAMIDKSFAAVMHGDMVMASMPSAPVVTPVRMREGLKGVVIAAAEEEVSISEREVVYIDRGSLDGVIVGDLFSIFSMPYYTQQALESKDKLPLFKSGEGVVIYVTPQTSTLLVTHSRDVIYAGDTIISGKGN
jgi:hypothetical protein